MPSQGFIINTQLKTLPLYFYPPLHTLFSSLNVLYSN